MLLISACMPTGEMTPMATPTAFPTLFMTRTLLPTATATPTPTAVPTTIPTPKPVTYLTFLDEFEKITLRNKNTNLVLVIEYTNVDWDMLVGYCDHEVNLYSIISNDTNVDISNYFVKKLSQIDPWYEGIQLSTSIDDINVYISEDWIVIQ